MRGIEITVRLLSLVVGLPMTVAGLVLLRNRVLRGSADRGLARYGASLLGADALASWMRRLVGVPVVGPYGVAWCGSAPHLWETGRRFAMAKADDPLPLNLEFGRR